MHEDENNGRKIDLAPLESVLERWSGRLERLPNVVATGIGIKEINDQISGRLCIKVYVTEKLPSSQLSDDHIVPATIEGYETDVVGGMEPPNALRETDEDVDEPNSQ